MKKAIIDKTIIETRTVKWMREPFINLLIILNSKVKIIGINPFPETNRPMVRKLATNVKKI
ncbi:MAG: hypothetical protein SVZ03_14180 [Spirochaetota bacterium]|nr:hypothetical protein [Spirochaetota bacterium]